MSNAVNPFAYSDDNKRYHTYNYYLRGRFGRKVSKVSLDLGLSCPNRDGTKGVGGCIFCSGARSGEFGGDPCESIESQFESVKSVIDGKWSGCLYIAYFQAGTNTYADCGFLKENFERALALPNVVGLSVATRCDCIDEQKADMLAYLSKRTYLVVELGLQTVHDDTALAINRCHTFGDFMKGYELLADRGINVCVHLIDGLPGEDRAMRQESARVVGTLSPHAVKLHLLHVLKGTKLAQIYQSGGYVPLDMEEYVNIVCDQLEVLPSKTVIERITGDGAKSELLAPMWSTNKFAVMNSIDKEMARRDSFQGKEYKV